MNYKDMVEKLKVSCKTDKTLDAIMHVFALRERARSQVTLGGLAQRMKSAGFEYGREQYVKALTELASAGLGKLQKDSKGRVQALVEIKVALQSLGKAVLEKGEPKPFKQRSTYQKIKSMRNTVGAPVVMTKGPLYGSGAETGKRQGFPVSITVLINVKPVNFRVDPSLDTQEIAEVITRFRDHGWDKEL